MFARTSTSCNAHCQYATAELSCAAAEETSGFGTDLDAGLSTYFFHMGNGSPFSPLLPTSGRRGIRRVLLKNHFCEHVHLANKCKNDLRTEHRKGKKTAATPAAKRLKGKGELTGCCPHNSNVIGPKEIPHYRPTKPTVSGSHL